VVGGPEFSDFLEDALIFALEIDDVQIPGSWLSVWASISFNDTLSSSDSSFYELFGHYTKSALNVHRRVIAAEEAAQDGS
jgi:hypothetical protein